MLVLNVVEIPQNIAFLSNLTKFRVVPSHLILHIFKVCLDDFSGTNVENIALLLEGCGRFLLRSDDTRERFATMVSRYGLFLVFELSLSFVIAGVDETQAKYATLRSEAASTT